MRPPVLSNFEELLLIDALKKNKWVDFFISLLVKVKHFDFFVFMARYGLGRPLTAEGFQRDNF